MADTRTRSYEGGFEYENGLLSIIHTGEGLVDNTATGFVYNYFLKDQLGNTRIVFSTGTGDSLTLEQSTDYYPFGLAHESGYGEGYTKYKYNGKEIQDDLIGGVALDWYDYGARFYDPQIGRWHCVDPLAEEYYSHSTYAYVMNNPIKYIDPDGTSTWVTDNGDGTYKVVGGDLEDKDKGIYIVTQDKDGNYVRTDADPLGESLTMFSFYNEDKQDGEAQVGWKGTIDINSTESADLVKGFMGEAEGIEIGDYMKNATDGKDYDFKRDGDPENNDREFHHRGSEFYTKEDGAKVYASARDAGNFSAGYYAASQGLTWKLARKGFDGYEIFKSALKGHFVSGEGRQSTHAQALGYARRKYGMQVGPSK